METWFDYEDVYWWREPGLWMACFRVITAYINDLKLWVWC